VIWGGGGAVFRLLIISWHFRVAPEENRGKSQSR
jgi:hypothetical protein